MDKLAKGTWVVIADGEKALFTCNETDGQDPNLQVIRQEAQDNPPNRDQVSSRQGRFQGAAGTHVSAAEETDWHRLTKERFAGDMADILYRQAHRGAFSQLVLVAPPETLGQLRSVLHQEVVARIVAEIPKTLTNHPLDEIEQIVKGALAD